jgi:hypothetical protein
MSKAVSMYLHDSGLAPFSHVSASAIWHFPGELSLAVAVAVVVIVDHHSPCCQCLPSYLVPRHGLRRQTVSITTSSDAARNRTTFSLHNFPQVWTLGMGSCQPKVLVQDHLIKPGNDSPRFLLPPAFNVFCAEASAHALLDAPYSKQQTPKTRLCASKAYRQSWKKRKDPILRISTWR